MSPGDVFRIKGRRGRWDVLEVRAHDPGGIDLQERRHHVLEGHLVGRLVVVGHALKARPA